MSDNDFEVSFDGWDEPAWSALSNQFRDLNLLQLWAYGDAKAASGSWRPERGLLTRAGMPFGAFQALIRKVPGAGFAWVNRGPLWRRGDDPPDPAALAGMLAALRREYVGRRGFYLRIAPALFAEESRAVDLAGAGFLPTGTRGWASATLEIDVDLADLRRRLHQKWRNALNKSERAGLNVRAASDGNVWDDFLRLHASFADSRRGEIGVDVELVSALQAHLPAGHKLVALVAYKGDAPIAGVLVARYGRVAEYLAGNSVPEGRTTAAGQLLLWRAVEFLRQQGIARFDLGGMDPERTPAGIFEFKQRVGGAPYRLADEIEAGGEGVVGRLLRWRVRRARERMA